MLAERNPLHFSVIYNYMTLDYFRRPSGDGVPPGSDGCFVYAVLASFADKCNKSWPSIATIQAITGLSRPTVHKALRRLVDVGLIAREYRKNEQGKDIAPLYTLLFPSGQAACFEGQLNYPSPQVRGKEITGEGQLNYPTRGKEITGEGKPDYPTRGKEITGEGKPDYPEVTPLEVTPIEVTPLEASLADEEEEPGTLFALSSQETPKKEKRQRAKYPAAFETWWDTYPNHSQRGKKKETFAVWESLIGQVCKGEVLTAESLQNIAENARDYYRDEPHGNEFAAGSEVFLGENGKYERYLHGMPAHTIPRGGNGKPPATNWQTPERVAYLNSLEEE